MNESLVGLDIGRSSLKVVEALKRGKTVKLLSCGLKTIPPDTGLKDLISLIKTLFAEARVSSQEVKISTAGKDIIIRYVIFPAMPKIALIRSLKFEYEKYIPFALNESVVDIDILEKRKDGKMNVLIVSAKKDFIEEKIKIVRGAGLVPKSISVDSLSLYKSFAESPFCLKKASFILLNLGCLITNLVVVKNGLLLFSRDINIGGETFTRSIADKMNLPFNEAEDLKRKATDSSLIETISTDLNSLINEIELSAEYAKKNHDLEEVECIYISGGSSKLKGLKEDLENKLKLRVDFWNPFTALAKVKNFEILESFYPDLILSLGIALV